jgi:hypothetical protein
MKQAKYVWKRMNEHERVYFRMSIGSIHIAKIAVDSTETNFLITMMLPGLPERSLARTLDSAKQSAEEMTTGWLNELGVHFR